MSLIRRLPEGVIFDKSTGLISGIPTEVGEFGFSVNYTNPCGQASRELKIFVDEKKDDQPMVGSNIITPNIVEVPPFGRVDVEFINSAAFTIIDDRFMYVLDEIVPSSACRLWVYDMLTNRRSILLDRLPISYTNGSLIWVADNMMYVMGGWGTEYAINVLDGTHRRILNSLDNVLRHGWVVWRHEKVISVHGPRIDIYPIGATGSAGSRLATFNVDFGTGRAYHLIGDDKVYIIRERGIIEIDMINNLLLRTFPLTPKGARRGALANNRIYLQSADGVASLSNPTLEYVDLGNGQVVPINISGINTTAIAPGNIFPMVKGNLIYFINGTTGSIGSANLWGGNRRAEMTILDTNTNTIVNSYLSSTELGLNPYLVSTSNSNLITVNNKIFWANRSNIGFFDLSKI
jgi:hypothetical protein